jgi:hypothetical protein
VDPKDDKHTPTSVSLPHAASYKLNKKQPADEIVTISLQRSLYQKRLTIDKKGREKSPFGGVGKEIGRLGGSCQYKC